MQGCCHKATAKGFSAKQSYTNPLPEVSSKSPRLQQAAPVALWPGELFHSRAEVQPRWQEVKAGTIGFCAWCVLSHSSALRAALRSAAHSQHPAAEMSFCQHPQVMVYESLLCTHTKQLLVKANQAVLRIPLSFLPLMGSLCPPNNFHNKLRLFM